MQWLDWRTCETQKWRRVFFFSFSCLQSNISSLKAHESQVDIEKLTSIVHWHVRLFISSKDLAGYRSSTVRNLHLLLLLPTLLFILHLRLWAQSIVMSWCSVWMHYIAQVFWCSVFWYTWSCRATYLGVKKKSLSLLRLFTGLLCHVYNGSSFLLLREIHLCSTKLF